MKIFFLIIFVLFIKSLLSQELTPKWYTLKFEQNHFEFDFPVEKKPDTYGKPFLYRSEWNNIYFRFAYHDSTSIKHDTLINNSIIETFAYKMLNVQKGKIVKDTVYTQNGFIIKEIYIICDNKKVHQIKYCYLVSENKLFTLWLNAADSIDLSAVREHFWNSFKLTQ